MNVIRSGIASITQSGQSAFLVRKWSRVRILLEAHSGTRCKQRRSRTRSLNHIQKLVDLGNVSKRRLIFASSAGAQLTLVA